MIKILSWDSREIEVKVDKRALFILRTRGNFSNYSFQNILRILRNVILDRYWQGSFTIHAWFYKMIYLSSSKINDF